MKAIDMSALSDNRNITANYEYLDNRYITITVEEDGRSLWAVSSFHIIEGMMLLTDWSTYNMEQINCNGKLSYPNYMKMNAPKN